MKVEIQAELLREEWSGWDGKRQVPAAAGCGASLSGRSGRARREFPAVVTQGWGGQVALGRLTGLFLRLTNPSLHWCGVSQQPNPNGCLKSAQSLEG